jgi:L-iditol 2-dehydrogenase
MFFYPSIFIRILLYFRLPDTCSFEQAALAEPLSVLLHASRRADLSAGQTILVFGVGTIGLLACALAKSQGVSKVVAIDINQTRLDFAKANGFASQVFCLPSVDMAKTTDEQLRRSKENIQIALAEFSEPDGFDLVFECTGAEPCIQMSVHVSIPS